MPGCSRTKRLSLRSSPRLPTFEACASPMASWLRFVAPVYQAELETAAAGLEQVMAAPSPKCWTRRQPARRGRLPRQAQALADPRQARLPQADDGTSALRAALSVLLAE